MKQMRIFSRCEFDTNPACCPLNRGTLGQEAKVPKVKSKRRKSHSGDAVASGDHEKQSSGRIEHLNYKVRISQIGVE